jgi:hypothetical protein
MRMTAWKAWYRGGSSYCSSGVDWADLPDDGLLGIVIVFDEFAPGTTTRLRRIVSGSDLYWMVDLLGRPTICQGSHEDKPEKRYPGASIKKGVWTSDEEMQRVNAEMAEWRG